MKWEKGGGSRRRGGNRNWDWFVKFEKIVFFKNEIKKKIIYDLPNSFVVVRQDFTIHPMLAFVSTMQCC